MWHTGRRLDGDDISNGLHNAIMNREESVSFRPKASEK